MSKIEIAKMGKKVHGKFGGKLNLNICILNFMWSLFQFAENSIIS